MTKKETKTTEDAFNAAMQAAAPQDGEKAPPAEKPDRFAVLEKKFDDAQAASDARQATLLDTIQTMVLGNQSKSVIPTQSPEAVAASLDPGEMPDIAKEPAEFRSWLDKRDTQVRAQAKIDADTAMAPAREQAQMTALWGDFSSKYSEQAKYTGLVQVAYNRAVEKYAGQGVSRDVLLTSGKERFLSDIAAEVDGELDAIRGGHKDVDPNADTREINEVTRTDALSDGTNRMPRTTTPKAEEEGNFMDEISNAQEKGGFV